MIRRTVGGEDGMELNIQRLTKEFASVKAVNEVTLRIPREQMVGIIGRSGAGKSTLLRMINRLIGPTEGKITFGSTEITALRGRKLLEWRARCAMIFQQFNLVKRLDVFTNVLIGRLNYHRTLPSLMKCFSREERAMAIQALDRVEITDQALQRVDTLSGGQQQRVAIARALLQKPEIILADEPIASLDLRSATMVMNTLQRINREDGIMVIASLHNLSTARNYCDRIIGIAHGRIVFDSVPADLTAEKIFEIYGMEEAPEELNEAANHRPVRTPFNPAVGVPAVS
jgi:phosphonate transport system ATP-binding protein